MVTKVENERAVALAAKREHVVEFSADRVSAPFFLRCGAFLLDYLLVLFLPLSGLLLGRLAGSSGSQLLNGDWYFTGWVIGIIFGALNLIVLPGLIGQSLGKVAARIRIVSYDGSAPSFACIALRQTAGYLTVILTLGIGFLIAAFGSRGRALHDFLFRTVVIHAERRVREKL